MVLVVMIHSNNLSTINTEPNSITYWIESIISNGIARIAVPVFFITSGFLFFNNKIIKYPQFFYNQIKKRVYTIGLPFVLWSLFGLLTFSFLQLIPQIKPYYNNFELSDLTVKLFIEKWLIYPVPFQLWFLQILLVCTILSPIIWKLLTFKTLKNIYLFTILTLWFFWGGYNGLTEYFFEGLLFFSIGAWIAINNITITIHPKKSWIITLTLLTLILLYFKFFFEIKRLWEISILFGKLSILTGIPVYWQLISSTYKKFENFRFINFSFWLFLAHEPLLTFIKKTLTILSLYITHYHSPLIVYILAPLITITVTIYLGKLISFNHPKLYAFLTGNR